MGTYINAKLKSRKSVSIKKINAIWDAENPGYEGLFHLNTQEDMKKWLEEIHTEESLKHLRWIKTTRQLDKTFPLWGLGCWQVKVTSGDYLCSDMAERYLRFFDKYAHLFEENPLDSGGARGEVESMTGIGHIADECLVDCPTCRKRRMRAQ